MAKKKEERVWHLHGCTRCHIRYEDTCRTSDVDGLCRACRGLRTWTLLIENAASKDCCIASSRAATKEEKTTYRLAGTSHWFICPTCKRTQPHNPRTWS